MRALPIIWKRTRSSASAIIPAAAAPDRHARTVRVIVVRLQTLPLVKGLFSHRNSSTIRRRCQFSIVVVDNALPTGPVAAPASPTGALDHAFAIDVPVQLIGHL